MVRGEITWYLAGPMSGIPQFNFPAFYEATRKLRSVGYDILSPAELDDEAHKGIAIQSPDGDNTNMKYMGSTYTDFLARDVLIIRDKVQGIVFLPNWDKSYGAKLEAFVGLLSGHKFGKYDSKHGIIPIDSYSVLDAIYIAIASGA